MYENIERVSRTEKLIANANEGKHIRKSRKSQKGGNEHKKLKNFECNAQQKATEQSKPTTETTEQEQRWVKEGRPKPEEAKKQFPGTHSLFSARKSFGKWEIKRRKRRAEATSTKFIDFAGSVRKSFAFLCSRPFGFHPFCSVSFSFPPFLFCVCLSSFLTSRILSAFLIVQTDHNNASLS
jgi:hypothetical protein